VQRDGFRGQQGIEITTSAPSSFTVADPVFLPWIGDSVVNAAAREITWIQDDDGTDAPDAMVIDLSWSRLNGKINDYYYWKLVLPPGTGTRAEIPPLPADLADILQSSDQPYVSGLGVYESAAIDTWHDVKVQPEWRMARPDQIGPGEQPVEVRYSGNGGGQGSGFH
jgi:hypothetical protein